MIRAVSAKKVQLKISEVVEAAAQQQAGEAVLVELSSSSSQ